VRTFSLAMQGGAKGLLINSIGLCGRAIRATADFTGQNGKLSATEPRLKTPCKKKRKKRQHHRRTPSAKR
jgi:hypothetical protein